MSSPKQMPFALSVSPNLSPLPDQFLAGFSALIRLNMDTCRSAVTGAALHWESVLLAQTPEQFIRRQADVMPWLAQQFAGYARGWMDIALEASRPRHAGSNHDDGHEHQESAMSAGLPACATGVDAMTSEAAPLEVQPDGESVAEAHAGEMARAILERVAKPTPDTAERRSPPRARRSSTR
ncbi:phasin family protein [Paraburkholderia sp. HD33-4]|uniref:phasin family protein n=1 Tax=Paraburkholderia sp. HD33-4 TaxID=2883242 RepID=UPI001F48B31E|nr:phasin family protein [Paraburkholderia sp. HD33-4]